MDKLKLEERECLISSVFVCMEHKDFEKKKEIFSKVFLLIFIMLVSCIRNGYAESISPLSEPTHILRIVQAIPNLQVRIVPYMIPGRTLRFLVNDDPDVDMYLSRDLDSVVNDKERKAVQEWIHSGKSLHLMHDSHQHVQAIQGGMFGVRKPFKMNMLHKLQSTFSSSQERWGTDIAFLTNHLLPHYMKSNDYLQHRGAGCQHSESKPFPSPYQPFPAGRIVGDIVNMPRLFQKNHLTFPVV